MSKRSFIIEKKEGKDLWDYGVRPEDIDVTPPEGASHFVGWIDTSDITNTIRTSASVLMEDHTKDTTYKASFGTGRYEVRLHPSGDESNTNSEFCEDAFCLSTFIYSEAYRVDSLPIPSASGYKFEAWQVKKQTDSGYVYESIPALPLHVSADMDLYACWTLPDPKSSFYVTFQVDYSEYPEGEHFTLQIGDQTGETIKCASTDGILTMNNLKILYNNTDISDPESNAVILGTKIYRIDSGERLSTSSPYIFTNECTVIVAVDIQPPPFAETDITTNNNGDIIKITGYSGTAPGDGGVTWWLVDALANYDETKIEEATFPSSEYGYLQIGLPEQRKIVFGYFSWGDLDSVGYLLPRKLNLEAGGVTFIVYDRPEYLPSGYSSGYIFAGDLYIQENGGLDVALVGTKPEVYLYNDSSHTLSRYYGSIFFPRVYVGTTVYGEGKVIFDPANESNPERWMYQSGRFTRIW